MTQTKRPNYVLWMLCVFMLLSAASYFFRPKEPEISYAEVVQLFEQEKVKSFTVQDTTLTLKLREAVDGKTELRKELYDFDLFYDDLNDLVVEQKAAGILEDYNYSANHSPNYLAIALPYVIAVAGLFAIWYFFSMRASGGGNDRMAKFGNATFRHGSESARKTTFADVAGADEEKEELAEIVDFLRDPQRFVELGARIPKGVLLVGPPGTGKTLLARAVAGEAGVEFLSISGSDFVEMYVGVGASRVRDLFEQAKKAAPCIIFIDEIDAVGRQRGTGLGGGHDEREQTLNQLLTEMDGFESNNGVIILAATNRPESLDPALTRPGRFDRRVPVELPDLKGREEILKVHAKKIKVAEDVDFNKIARMASGASGAELANIVNEAALRAVRAGRRFATESDLEESIEVVIAGYQKKNAILTDHEKWIVAYHETGHALVAALQSHSAPVQKITIIPRTSGALGYTMQVEEGNHYLMTREEMENKIATLTGGRAAEEVRFGSVTTGASNDIEQATKLARAMVTRYGMSEDFDMVALETVTNQYLGGDASLACSAETQTKIDALVVALVKREHEKAVKLLTDHRAKLDELSQYLYEKETITGEEFMKILNLEKAQTGYNLSN
ncbi:aTP-dependent zinc metalloprotease FtsH 1 [Firmicutes bacterium CAG:129]|nr:aTP-dependent zinc metalloprotease FtsH 1 [Firmicutes bacterium CAG:129]